MATNWGNLEQEIMQPAGIPRFNSLQKLPHLTAKKVTKATLTVVSINSNYGDPIPYVAFIDGGAGGAISVKMFDGDSWQDVGDPPLNTGAASQLSMAAFPFDDPSLFVAYIDETGKARVQAYVPTGFDEGEGNGWYGEFTDYEWVDLGVVSKTAAEVSIAVHPHPEVIIFVAYKDSDDNITVKESIYLYPIPGLTNGY